MPVYLKLQYRRLNIPLFPFVGAKKKISRSLTPHFRSLTPTLLPSSAGAYAGGCAQGKGNCGKSEPEYATECGNKSGGYAKIVSVMESIGLVINLYPACCFACCMGDCCCTFLMLCEFR